MLLLILFLLCIALLSFPIFFYCSSVCDPPVSSTTAEILEKTQHIVLKMCSHKWEMITLFLSQCLTFQSSQFVVLFPNYVLSIKSLTTSSTFLLIFLFTNLWQVMLLLTLILSPLPSLFVTHLIHKLICPFSSLYVEFTFLSYKT